MILWLAVSQWLYQVCDKIRQIRRIGQIVEGFSTSSNEAML